MTPIVKIFLMLSAAVSLANAFAPMSRIPNSKSPLLHHNTVTTTTSSTGITIQNKKCSKFSYNKHCTPQRSQVVMHLKDENMTEEERAIALEKATKAMTAFSNTYIKNTGTKYCSDLSIPAVVIKGLAEHKVTLGAPLCPCRFYEDKEKEAKDGFWNCPCVPMRERHECHCMLFLTEDNDFVGDKTSITYEEVIEKSGGMMT